MDKGIRAYARTYFVAQNELRRKGEAFTGPKGNTAFRKEVMGKLMEEFGCTLQAAATHYNEAFKLVKEATPELVAGLGRAASAEQARADLERATEAFHARLEQDKKLRQEAVAAFEELVKSLGYDNAKLHQHQAHGTGGDDEYLCDKLGLPYCYFEKAEM
jgi:predicted TIM-barrel fold metal-dependent hydrolase